jgi:hypothetical protein
MEQFGFTLSKVLKLASDIGASVEFIGICLYSCCRHGGHPSSNAMMLSGFPLTAAM